MAQIAPIYLSTTIITSLKDNQEKGTASGFFYVDRSDNLFLITNKHVIYGENYPDPYPNPKIDKLKLKLHVDQNCLSKNEPFEIPLLNGEKKLWLVHKNADIDVVVLPVNINRNKYLIRPIDDSFFNSKDLIIDFKPIFIVGYPYGWYDESNNLPITMTGHFASPFDADFNGQPFMLGNVECYKGMSGGPVYIYLDYYIDQGGNVRVGTRKQPFILVGICSAKPELPKKDNFNLNASLITIWNYRLIQEILSSSSYSQFKQKP